MYARSPIFDAPERAEKVLRRFRDLCSQNALGNKPDEYSYSLLLKAWYVKFKSARLHGMNNQKLTLIASSYMYKGPHQSATMELIKRCHA